MAAKKKRVVTKKITRKKKQSFAVQIAIAFIVMEAVALVVYIYNSFR